MKGNALLKFLMSHPSSSMFVEQELNVVRTAAQRSVRNVVSTERIQRGVRASARRAISMLREQSAWSQVLHTSFTGILLDGLGVIKMVQHGL